MPCASGRSKSHQLHHSTSSNLVTQHQTLLFLSHLQSTKPSSHTNLTLFSQTIYEPKEEENMDRRCQNCGHKPHPQLQSRKLSTEQEKQREEEKDDFDIWSFSWMVSIMYTTITFFFHHSSSPRSRPRHHISTGRTYLGSDTLRHLPHF